jgi:dienelactone hydrolase
MIAAPLLLAAAGVASPAAAVISSRAPLGVPCAASAVIEAEWHFPAAAPPLGLVWLQHGFARRAGNVRDLATHLARQGLLVVAPDLGSFDRPCGLHGPELADALAQAFAASRSPESPLAVAARAAAAAASLAPAPLPEPLGFVGHSAGAATVLTVAARLRSLDPQEASRLRAVVLLDPVDGTDRELQPALAALGPGLVKALAAPPGWCNAFGAAAAGLDAFEPGFAGVELAGGSHCDAEGATSDWMCDLLCGASQPLPADLLRALASNWLVGELAGSRNPDAYPGGPWLEALRAAGLVRVF